MAGNTAGRHPEGPPAVACDPTFPALSVRPLPCGRPSAPNPEQEIVPLFYKRSSDGLPRGWLRMMKSSISTLNPVFNTGRMVGEYTTTCYLPSAQRYLRLTANNLAGARALAEWRKAMARGWQQVRVVSVDAHGADPMHVGSELQVKAKVSLGSLSPQDVQVQLFHGLVDSFGDIPQPRTVAMHTNGAKLGERNHECGLAIGRRSIGFQPTGACLFVARGGRAGLFEEHGRAGPDLGPAAR